MSLHPTAARWFEVVVPSADAGDTMEALAQAGEVQFDWNGEPSAASDLEPLRDSVKRYRELATKHGALWPDPVFEKRCCALPVQASAAGALRSIERWLAGAGPSLHRLEGLGRERAELDLWDAILSAEAIGSMHLARLARAGPALAGACLVLRQDMGFPQEGLVQRFAVGDRIAYLGVLPREQAETLCARARSAGGTCLDPPAWLGDDAGSSRRALAERRHVLDREIRDLIRELELLAQRKGVARASGVLERVAWFLGNAEKIRCDGDYCWITGWTSIADPAVVEGALRERGVEAHVSLMEPPLDASSPSVSRHAGWLQAFEVFTRAIGVPGVREADPTTWVALLVPLMFGYMCGDVGHGAVFLVAGLVIRRRSALWPLFVFAGVASMGFGFAYGAVFGFETLLEPLWVRPLDEPLLILLVPLVLGALVLTLGMLLHLVQTCWRGEGTSEGVSDGAQVLVYWGLLLALVDVRFLWLVPVGAAVCLANRLRMGSSLAALAKGFGNMVESTFTLLLNTLSFARVGAFALAHAALETAVFAAAEVVESLAAAVAVLVAGNLAVVVIEGLVVGVQTARLVLFEFFMRFFEGRGRPFQPVEKPPAAGG